MAADRSLVAKLHARGPVPDRYNKMGLYGWLIGRWAMDATVYGNDGPQRGTGEIHFGWVLEGRAIQDIWILPGVFRPVPPDQKSGLHICFSAPNVGSVVAFHEAALGKEARTGDAAAHAVAVLRPVLR